MPLFIRCFRVYSACCTLAKINGWRGPRPTSRFRRAFSSTTRRQHIIVSQCSSGPLHHPQSSLTKQCWELSPPLSLSTKTQQSPQRVQTLSALNSISFSLECDRIQPYTSSGCLRCSASADITFSDSGVVPASIGPISSRIRRRRAAAAVPQASGHRGLLFRLFRTYSTNRSTKSPLRAKIASTSEFLVI